MRLNKHITAVFVCVLTLLLQPLTVTAATSVKAIQGLMAEGKPQEALKLTNQELARDPDNVNYQFTKGLILIRLNRLKQAEDIFLRITEEHPELPEPYNNLAVIYAAMGDLDKARDALQEAINTHPSYATAHENIGDIYAKLASQAYNQALELDRENTTAKAKLSLINDLFSVPKPAPTALAQAEPPAQERGVPAETERGVPAETEQASPPVQPPQPEPAPEPAPAAPAQTAAAESTPPAGKADRDTAAPQQAIVTAVRGMVNDWAEAWSSQDVPAYLSFYDREFTPPAGQSRADWEQERRDRVSSPGFIRVKISDLEVEPLGREYAQATFIQKYQSDTYGDLVTKLLLLVKRGDDWRIVQEATK